MKKYPFQIGLMMAICATAATGTAASTVYVPSLPGELAADAKVNITAPAPVQLTISFTTNGAPNAEATEFVKPIVSDAMKASGVFSTISETPVESGGSLNIVFDNVEEEGAVKKGVVVGLTFGLVGALATDRITAKFTYLPVGTTQPVTTSVDHAILTLFGNKRAPEGAVKAKNLDDAAGTVIRQSVDHGLNRIAADPRFAATAADVSRPASPSSQEEAAKR